jgi:hypothetical protein
MMEKELFQRVVGIIIVVALAGSMLAGAFIWMPDTPSPNDIVIPSQQSSIEYQTSFTTTAIQDLEAIRIIGETSELNKNIIDLSIQGIEGVSRIQSSRFEPTGGKTWFYLADISLRRNSNINEIVENIFSLEYFVGETDAMKRMSISTPETNIELKNPSLNLERNFKFEYETTFAITPLNTLSGDEIIVQGNITMQGNEIVFIELMEQINLELQPKYFEAEKEFELLEVGNELFFEVQGDFNKEFYSEQANAIADTIAFPINNTLMGQSIIERKEELIELFQDYNLDLKISGKIFIEELFVEELGELVFEEEFTIELSHEQKVGNIINVIITISKIRDEIKLFDASEKLNN